MLLVYMIKNHCFSFFSVIAMSNVTSCNLWKLFFFYVGFLSRTFTIPNAAGEGGGYLFNSSLPLPSASQTLRH